MFHRTLLAKNPIVMLGSPIIAFGRFHLPHRPFMASIPLFFIAVSILTAANQSISAYFCAKFRLNVDCEPNKPRFLF
jgi:hypothetical protein